MQNEFHELGQTYGGRELRADWFETFGGSLRWQPRGERYAVRKFEQLAQRAWAAVAKARGIESGPKPVDSWLGYLAETCPDYATFLGHAEQLDDEGQSVGALGFGRIEKVVEASELAAGTLEAEAKPAESAEPAPPKPAAVAVKQEEMKILESLAREHPATVTQEKLAADTGLSEKTVGNALRRLGKIGLTHRPLGKRKGDGLTDRGLSVVRR
jgi:hypothetical protein